MDAFFPFIHQIDKKKKKQDELQPLYIEIEPPPMIRKDDESEKDDSHQVIVIEL